jgi:hypothetical protein
MKILATTTKVLALSKFVEESLDKQQFKSLIRDIHAVMRVKNH